MTTTTEGLIHEGALDGSRTLPLLIQSNIAGISLSRWAGENVATIDARLRQSGGILFRGFDLGTQAAFEQFVESLPIELMHYKEGATPRTRLSDKVYTSTEYPADQPIALHNELSYVATWPMKVLFFCLTPPAQRGETPIADVRKVYARLRPEIVERFREKGWMLVRNFDEGMSLPWQSSFGTSDRATVESYCRAAQIACEWKPGDRLRTRQVRPAVAKHPATGEMVWFNHVAFWHVSSLDADTHEAMLAAFAEEDLPYNTYYGDGTRIEESVIAELNQAYREETVTFPWQQGDLLLLDNMLTAHGRSPYAGPRRILVAMGDPCSDRGIQAGC
jgi:alpha-ketoglutarate-dependent taurine dioxygenase